MANLLSDEPMTNSIMPKVIIHVLNVQEILGLDGFQKDSKTYLFEPNGETDQILAKEKDGFQPGLKGTCHGPYQEHILHLSKSWSSKSHEIKLSILSEFSELKLFVLGKNLSCFLVSHIQVNTYSNRWTCASYQATTRDPSLGGLVSHIKHHLESEISETFRNLRAILQSIQFSIRSSYPNRTNRVIRS
ncbi:hypothetical protein YC2023_015735 [Brassica napus]